MTGGGGGETVVQPSTTTTVQDIPAWEQGYVENLLGQAQTIAAQPYQQFPGQQVAGFTPDQTQAFSNVEGQQANINPLQYAATGQSAAGANTANNIYGAGAGDINASTMAASPFGIQQYMSPYTNDVVQGIQNEANQNWNQNIMPGLNNEFVGSGQSASGRNAQVLGQAAGNFQTGLSSNVSNALQSGYTTAGNQAATEAGLLGSAGSTLGNLAATQAGTQLSAGTNLQNVANSQNANALTNNQALQAVGQQQQSQNQTNLNTAQTNWQNQVNWPASQTEYLNQIIRGLPAPSASTSAGQSPANSVSPLAGIGGSSLSLAGLGALGQKEGGLIKGYAEGGSVDDDYDAGYDPTDPVNPLAMVNDSISPAEHLGVAPSQDDSSYSPNLSMDTPQLEPYTEDNAPPAPSSGASAKNPMDDSSSKGDESTSPKFTGISPSQLQNLQLLEMARGLLTPQPMGQAFSALGQGVGNMSDITLKAIQMQQQQQQLNFENQLKSNQAAQEAPLKAAQANYYNQGAGTGNRAVSVIGPDGKPVLMPARDAIAQGLTPSAGYNTNNVTMSPAAIKMMSDAIASGVPANTLGLGIGANANKSAVYDQLAQDHPEVKIADVQAQFGGEKAAAKTVGNTSGRIEFASESLGSMMPLAKQASAEIDRTQYPDINAISNAVAKGTGDTKIIGLNTYLNAVIGDQAALIARSGVPTDAARATARESANAAFTQGQLNAYFDAVGNEIKAQRAAGKSAMSAVTNGGVPPGVGTASPPTSQSSPDSGALAEARRRGLIQ